MEKEKNTPRRRWWLWIGGCLGTLLVVGALAFGGLVFFLGSMFEDTSQCDLFELTPTGLESVSGIDLPESVSNFTMNCDGFFDNHTFDGQFTLPAADLNALQAGVPGVDNWAENPLLTEDRVSPLDDVLPRGDIESMASYMFGDGPGVAFLIDTSDPALYTVYFFRSVAF